MKNELDYIQRLEKSGHSRKQAETHVQVIGDVLSDEFATRTALKETEYAIRSDMKEMENSLRSDMKEMENSIRADMKEMENSLRSDMKDLEHKVEDLRKDMIYGFQQMENKIIIKLGSLMVAMFVITGILFTVYIEHLKIVAPH